MAATRRSAASSAALLGSACAGGLAGLLAVTASVTVTGGVAACDWGSTKEENAAGLGASGSSKPTVLFVLGGPGAGKGTM